MRHTQLPRRSLLQIGLFGTLGLSLPECLRRQTQAAPAGGKKLSAIFVWLGGGPSHHDTFDPKPDATAEIRGMFRPIATSVPGIRVAESLPRLAPRMEQLAVIRSVTHADAAHEPGVALMQTGYHSRPGTNFPSMGAIVGYERRSRSQENGLPAHIAVPNGDLGAGHLGSSYNPFRVGGNPSAPDFQVQDLGNPGGLSVAQLHQRHELLRRVNNDFRVLKNSDVQQSVDRFGEQAFKLMVTPEARTAFDLTRESAATRDRYGRTQVGQSMLMARRLIEANVPFVTVNDDEWDHHSNIFPRLKEKLPPVDQGLAALVGDLADRGLLDHTLVVMMGEFGRTPKINTMGGRDHWSRAFSVVLTGAGVRGGQVIGASDADGAFPADRPVTPADLAHSIYKLLGLDPDRELPTTSGRPVQIVRDGTFIRELLG
ncbi:MAG: DUF1501 domain-containing protein [Planctomycetia bacterium]|nr:DUF1501 domain-containing protein [Planctomycetia bacterium]